MQKLQLKTQLFNTTLDLMVEESTQTVELLNSILNVASQLQASFNIYDPNSEISKLNTDKQLLASPYLVEILELAKKYEQLTDYYFNTNQLFTEQNNIEITNNLVTVHNPVDLGGIAKGYLMALVQNILLKHHLSFEMNFGGSLLLSTNKLVSIRSMDNPLEHCIQFELPKYQAIHTSSYYFQIDGDQSHIHSKADNYEILSKSVSVIDPNPILADVFSTALYCMPIDTALGYIRKYQLTVIYCFNHDVYVTSDLLSNDQFKVISSDLCLHQI